MFLLFRLTLFLLSLFSMLLILEEGWCLSRLITWWLLGLLILILVIVGLFVLGLWISLLLGGLLLRSRIVLRLDIWRDLSFGKGLDPLVVSPWVAKWIG